MKQNIKLKNGKILKYENHTIESKKEDKVAKKKPKDKTLMGVIGVILTLFGIIGSIPVLQNRQYLWLIITAIAVILGVILVASSLNN